MTLFAVLETGFSRKHYFDELLNTEANIKSVLWEARSDSTHLQFQSLEGLRA